MNNIFDELNSLNSNIDDTMLEAEQRWINNPRNPNDWLDSEDATPNGDGTFTMIVVPCKMPYEYVIEMLCDFVGASKAYRKEAFTIEEPWNYWVNSCEGKRAMHKTSEYLIKKLLWNLHEAESINSFVEWYKQAENYLRRRYEDNSLVSEASAGDR